MPAQGLRWIARRAGHRSARPCGSGDPPPPEMQNKHHYRPNHHTGKRSRIPRFPHDHRRDGEDRGSGGCPALCSSSRVAVRNRSAGPSRDGRAGVRDALRPPRRGIRARSSTSSKRCRRSGHSTPNSRHERSLSQSRPGQLRLRRLTKPQRPPCSPDRTPCVSPPALSGRNPENQDHQAERAIVRAPGPALAHAGCR